MPFLAPLVPVIVGAVASTAAGAAANAISGASGGKDAAPQVANVADPLAASAAQPLDAQGQADLAAQQAKFDSESWVNRMRDFPSGLRPTAPAVGPLSTAYQGNQSALKSQQDLLSALGGQNGIQNQSNVFNQMQGVANGTGPNPAQAMLNQTTGANVANQAALMAGQRGAASNVGMIARQAAQQGANIQQQAAGQGATMQANQQLNALNQLGGIAGQQVNQQIGATQGNTAAQQAEQQNLLNAQAQYNQTQAGQQGSVNAANAGSNTANTNARNDIAGGLASGIGAVGNVVFGGKANDGINLPNNNEIQMKAEGGPVAQAPMQQAQPVQPQGPQSVLGQALRRPQQTLMARGGAVPALVSPGEKYLPPSAVDAVKRGADPMKVGETIPGKPKVGGARDSYSNDTVPKTLEEGGIVVPRSKTQSKSPSKSSQEFVMKTLSKRRGKR